jgi:hypothetical protein
MSNALVMDVGGVITDLRDVEDQSQFEGLYRSKGLRDTADKIGYLKTAMKIRATCCDDPETPEEILAGLEETALLGYWKAYR